MLQVTEIVFCLGWRGLSLGGVLVFRRYTQNRQSASVARPDCVRDRPPYEMKEFPLLVSASSL